MRTFRKMLAVCAAAVMLLGIVGVRPAKAVGGKWDIDLRGGYRIINFFTEPFTDILAQRGIVMSDNGMFDLDGDGSYDLRLIYTYSPYTEYYSELIVIIPVANGSIKGDYTLKSDAAHPMIIAAGYDDEGNEITEEVTEIVFHFPQEEIREKYSVRVNGGKAFRRYMTADGEWTEEETDSIAPGELIRFEEEKKSGQYMTGWNSEGIRSSDLVYTDYDGGRVVVRNFIMPAHDVTLTPAYKTQTPYTITFDGTGDYKIGSFSYPTTATDCFLNALYHYSSFRESYEANGYIDLDGDGTDDIYVGPNKGSESLSVCLFANIDSYTMTAPNDGPYWPITLRWDKESVYKINPESLYYAALSPKNARLLYQSLKPFEVERKEGFFDLDRDGTEDLHFDGRTILTLSTCSVENTITIPAAENGVNHPITFDLRDKSTRYIFHKCTVICENEGKVSLNPYEWDLIGEWFEEGEYVRLTPGEGYEFADIQIDGNSVTLEDFDRSFFYDFCIPNHDVEIRILFRTEDGKIPGYHRVQVQGDYDVYVQQGYDFGPAQYDPYVKEGDRVIINRNERTEESYVASWEVTGVKDYTIGENVSLQFVMQDKDVVVKPIFGKVEPLTIDLSSGSCSVTEEMIESITSALGHESQTVQVRDYDLNGDKKSDIRIDLTTMQIKPLDGYSCGETYELREMNSFGRYHPITFVYKAEAEESEITETPANSSEKKEDSDSFHPMYFIIPACVLLCGGVTAALLVRRKKRVVTNETAEAKPEESKDMPE